jgi:AraC-like DNA-binding protein
MTESYPNIYIYKRIVQAKLFIDNHFAENIDLHNIADEACFSRFHFIRLFRSIYGKTPHQYLISVRIENAMRFLQQGFSVTETCFMVGFESVSSFTGLFKRITRHPPSLYQQQQRERQSQIQTSPLHFVPACFARQKGWL